MFLRENTDIEEATMRKCMDVDSSCLKVLLVDI